MYVYTKTASTLKDRSGLTAVTLCASVKMVTMAFTDVLKGLFLKMNGSLAQLHYLGHEIICMAYLSLPLIQVEHVHEV